VPSVEPEASPEAVDYFSRDHPLRCVVSRVALRARVRMYRRVERSVTFAETTTVLDVGATPDTGLPDSNFFEALYPYPHRLTVTSIEDASALERQHPGLTFVRTDGRTLPFDDRHFDVAFSSAVVEHVGPAGQRRFVEEMCRVADVVVLTTPNRWFPVELHTFLPLLHWLPRRVHRAALRRLRLGFWADPSNLHLVGERELRALFPPDRAVEVARHRTAGWCSNLIVIARIRPA